MGWFNHQLVINLPDSLECMVILRDFPTNCIVWVGVIYMTSGCYLLLQREWSEDLEERHQKCFPSAGVSQLQPSVELHTRNFMGQKQYKWTVQWYNHGRCFWRSGISILECISQPCSVFFLFWGLFVTSKTTQTRVFLVICFWKFFAFTSTKNTTSWWFQLFFISTPTWGNDPIWLICFKWVETTN